MKVETVVVFRPYDLDHKNKTLFGLTVHLLNAVDRVELNLGDKYIQVNKRLFEKEDWFDELLEIMK